MRGEVVHEMRDESLKCDGVPQDREHVEKDNALRKRLYQGEWRNTNETIPSWGSRGVLLADFEGTRRPTL